MPSACPACGHQNPPGQKFCGECGAKLAGPATPSAVVAAATPVIAQEPVVSPPAPTGPSSYRAADPVTYTPKHLAEKILTSKSAVEGERKRVTVMFVDVSGFTAMSERLDPEDVHAIMDRAFEGILEAVHRYEGTINQFLGDGVMALFGAPIAHEDHPHRALSAALAIQEGLKPLRDDVRRTHGAEFRVRMGINTGGVVVGAIGKDLRMDYTAVGDTTNLAARFLGLAQPGQIVVSQRTQQLTEGFFVLEDLGEFQVKGKTEPVRAYALISEVRGRTRLEVSKERGLTPLVGRAHELRRLAEAHHRADGGHGAIVLLEGDAGVGKSRLLYEFLRTLEGSGIVELEVTCGSYYRSMAYRPISELVRRHLGLSEAMEREDIRKHVGERLGELGLQGEDRTVLVSHFLGLSAPPEFLNRVSGAQLKERTLGVLRDLFLRTSESALVLLVIENVHWLDPSSEEFLAHLTQSLPGHRVLMILSTRPGYTAPWLGPPLADTVTVEGLHGGDIRGMVQTLLTAEEVSEPLFKLLIEKSEGNPLYVEEILRQLQETAGIVVHGGEARLQGADVTVPATIHDIIAARIDRLSGPHKQTLQGAAIVGRRFGISLLSRVLDLPGEHVTHQLSELHTLDFVFPSAQEPELMYSFKHALTQDVVYTSVLERRRRQHHAAAGRGLEELYAGRTDDVVDLLAYHFGRSGEAEKAVDYAILAAENAQHRWANTEALDYFDDAVKRLSTMPDTEANRLRKIDAVVKQAEVKFALGRQAEQIQALEGIRDLVERVGDRRRRASWHSWTGFIHSLTGAPLQVPLAHCREAVAIADAEGLDDIKAFAECSLANVYLVAGEIRNAFAAGVRALEFFESRGNVWWSCRTLWGLTHSAAALGEWKQSLDYGRRALEHGQAVNDVRLKVVALWRMGHTHILQGAVSEGLRCCEEALALSPAPFDAACIRAVKGYGLVKSGETEAGVAELAEALAWLDRAQLGHFRLWFAPYLAEGHLRHGAPARARAILEEMENSRGVSRRFEGISERLLGETLAPEDPAAAAAHLAAAMRILEEIGARNELAKALATHGELQRAAGDTAGARQSLERALAIFDELGTLDEPARVRGLLAAIEGDATA